MQHQQPRLPQRSRVPCFALDTPESAAHVILCARVTDRVQERVCGLPTAHSHGNAGPLTHHVSGQCNLVLEIEHGLACGDYPSLETSLPFQKAHAPPMLLSLRASHHCLRSVPSAVHWLSSLVQPAAHGQQPSCLQGPNFAGQACMTRCHSVSSAIHASPLFVTCHYTGFAGCCSAEAVFARQTSSDFVLGMWLYSAGTCALQVHAKCVALQAS